MRKWLIWVAFGGLIAAHAFSAVTVENLPCGVRIQADPVPGASSYVFRRALVNYCGEFMIVSMWSEPLGGGAAPELELTSAPPFSGTYQVDAIGITGAVLSTQISSMLVNQPGRGHFYHRGSSGTIHAMPGEVLTIPLGESVPTGTIVEWIRNGEIVQSGTGQDLVWTVQPNDHGAVFVARVFNSCGSSEGPARLLQVNQAPAATLVRWEGARSVNTLRVPGYYIFSGPCIGCHVPIDTRIEQSVPDAACISIQGDSFSTSCSSFISTYRTQTEFTRLQFALSTPATLRLSGNNQIPANQFTGPCGSVSGSISGSVTAALPTSTGPWGPLEFELPPGTYEIKTIAAGSVFCQSSSMLSCSGPCAMQLTGQIRPRIITVPGEYPTIQAAIDSVPAGATRSVIVSPGVYNEPFSLNGKDVRIEGARGGATVLDGAGLSTSIVRFTGGEPATAGVANLVFRNGTAGSRIFPKASFSVGGAVYGLNSAATIKNCRFEQNEADFGGAVYLLRCDSAVEACVFAGNEALTDGGAFFAYECAGFVRSSDFTANSCGAIGSGNGGAFKTVGGKTAGGTFLLQDCSITGTISGVDGAAIHHFENSDIGTRGLLRIVDTEISANATVIGAAGVRNDGPQTALVLAGTTAVCGNTPRNVGGPFLIEGGASVCGCLADVTGDGQVNGGDLGIVLNSWGGADALGSGDVNHDGVIDASDLSVVLSNWGACGN
ncbi:MAG: hypothetical protein RLZZ116_92 [Planctomycetota bacterium]|jgi:hypothetical protein